MTFNQSRPARAAASLRSAFVADSLTMPVHWFYNPADIFKAFPGGINNLEAAPAHHPSSIMALHSTSQGGRHGKRAEGTGREIVGDVILKGRRQFWGKPNCHYHHGMGAGENTLNAHCARVLMRILGMDGGRYDANRFLQAYIDFMTAEPPQHPDTYAESYHRGFFANLESGRAPDQCGAVTHDTASIGGLVTIAPLVLAGRLRGVSLATVQDQCRQHLMLTHPDQALAEVCAAYVGLLDDLLNCDSRSDAQDALEYWSRESVGASFLKLTSGTRSDFEIIGGTYSPACYISGAWPGVLYLARKYLGQTRAGLTANANLGGDNVHRGFVLGTILGLVDGTDVENWYHSLTDRSELDREIDVLACTSAGESSSPASD